MVRIPLPGVPKHLKEMVVGGLRRAMSGMGFVLVWRLFLLAALVGALYVAVAATGGSGALFIIFGIVLTSVLSAIIRDDALAIWSDLWHLRFAEVEI